MLRLKGAIWAVLVMTSLGVILLGAAPTARADPGRILLKVDQIKPVDLKSAAADIFIANPAVAEAVLHSQSQLILQGRMPGETDILAFGHDGKVLARWQVGVTLDQGERVTVYRGASRQTLLCQPFCQPELAFGDDLRMFINLESQANRRNELIGNLSGARGERESGDDEGQEGGPIFETPDLPEF